MNFRHDFLDQNFAYFKYMCISPNLLILTFSVAKCFCVTGSLTLQVL